MPRVAHALGWMRLRRLAVDFGGKVSVEKNGRSGFVTIAAWGRVLRLSWEYGGGDCIAIVNVPNLERWRDLFPCREQEREPFIAGLASEIARLECPHATIEIGPEAVYFLEPS